MGLQKLAGISFTEKEVHEIKQNMQKGDEYIVRYKTIYQIFYSQNAGLYTNKVYQAPCDQKIGYTGKGHFIITDSNFVNRLVGFDLLHTN